MAAAKHRPLKAYSTAVVAALTIVEGIDKFPFAIKPKVISNFFLSRKSEEKKEKKFRRQIAARVTCRVRH